MRFVPVRATIPLDAAGVHHGHLKLLVGSATTAAAQVMIPITVISNGTGPTALLTGAIHGDEHEGPAALQHLAATLDPAAITGRVIILPMLNQPAFAQGLYLSPIDGADMDRNFPGRADGTVTQKICHYLSTVLVPLADVVLDFHSGSQTLDFVPFAAAHILEDAAQHDACMAAAQAFGAPYTLRMLKIDNLGMFHTEVEGQGKVFVSARLGRGRRASARSTATAHRGIRNLLIHAGILQQAAQPAAGRVLDMPDAECFVFARHAGLVEYLFDPGDRVEAGETLARIWPDARSGADPALCRAERGGILAARHRSGLIKVGDVAALIAKAL